MVLAIAKIFDQMKSTRIIFSFLGKYSFEVMALHFSIFKLLDLVYGKLCHKNVSAEILKGFPTSGVLPTGLYVLAGCIIPAIIGLSVNQIWVKIKRKCLV